MTKKEMVYDIISNTKLSGMSERRVNNIISKVKKERVEEVYRQFEKDKSHALFYYNIITLIH